MSDTAAAAPAKQTPKKKTTKPKKPANHPKYSEMVGQAISSLKERGGSSRQAILKYIMKNFNVGADEKVVNQHLKIALRAGGKNNSLKQSKGSGASGSFRLGEVAKKPAKPKAATKPTSAKKAKKPKKAKTPKKAMTPKKAKTPKKGKVAKKEKTPKKANATKPVKAKSAKKPAAAKPKKAVKPKKPAAKKAAQPKKPAAKK